MLPAETAPAESEPGLLLARQRRRPLVVLELAAVFFVVLVTLTVASLRFGLTWDEVTYFYYTDSIRDWWHAGAPTDAASLDRYWGYDTYHNAHPPFMKILAAVCSPWAARWLPFPTDYRISHFLWLAGCVAGIYWLLRGTWSAPASLAAVALVAFQPRVFGQLLIAAHDSPVALAWILVPLLGWRLDDEPPGRRRAGLWIALFFVLAWSAATKVTGLLPAIPLGAFLLWRRRWHDVLLLAGAGAVAVAFTVAVMPNTWHHPLAGAFEYLAYPIRRRGMLFSTAYFGKMYRDDLPWHYADVMTLVTAPPLLLVALPAAALARGPLRRLLVPVGFALGFWLVLVHLPRTPRHDEVRQFVSACALLGLVAWVGIVAALDRVARSRRSLTARPGAARALAAAACLAAAAVPCITVARAHPHELSYYNRLIGGVRGAEAAGMELSLYFEALNRDGLAAIERDTRPGQTIYMRPAWPGLLTTYAEHGALRADIGLLPPNTDRRPDWLLLVRRRFINDEGYYLTVPATYEVRYDGVSLLKLVRMDDADRVTGGRP